MTRDRTLSALRPLAPERALAANDAPPAPGERIALRDGRELFLRPIHPDDVGALQRGFAHLTPEQVRMRFLHVMKELPAQLAQRLCRIDPEVELALVLVDRPDADAGHDTHEICAVARAFIDTTTNTAEFAIVVQQALTGQGLGTMLLQRLIAACRARGVDTLWGDVLAANVSMLEVCDQLGFERRPVYHDAGLVRVTLTL